MGGRGITGLCYARLGHRAAQQQTGGYADQVLDRLKRERDRLGVSLLPGDGKLCYGGERWYGWPGVGRG
jgi:hypothetical protein